METHPAAEGAAKQRKPSEKAICGLHVGRERKEKERNPGPADGICQGQDLCFRDAFTDLKENQKKGLYKTIKTGRIVQVISGVRRLPPSRAEDG